MDRRRMPRAAQWQVNALSLALSSVATVSPTRPSAAPASPAWAQLGVQVPEPQRPTTVLKARDAAAPKPE